MNPTPSPVTRAVRAGLCADPGHRSVMPPIHLSSNFQFESPGVYARYDYTRSGNPTRDLAAEAIAELEGGCGAVVTSSGMSAIAVVTRLLSAGDLLLAPHDCYGGSHRLFSAEAARGSYEVRFLDQTVAGARARARAMRPRMIWIETPSNPLLRITDIAAWTRLAREIGAVCVVDNTFLSPVNQRPLDFGVDLVVHSTTKFLNGHSDVVGGAVIAADEELFEDVAWWTNAMGVAGAPFDSYMTLRGIRTLHARVRAHEGNALRVVELLTGSDVVSRVNHPGLPEHPGHETARRQQLGWGSLISFELRGGARGGRGIRRRSRALRAGRVARGRREPGRAPGDDDARVDGPARPDRGRDPRGSPAAVGRDRVGGRPGGRSGARPLPRGGGCVPGGVTAVAGAAAPAGLRSGQAVGAPPGGFGCGPRAGPGRPSVGRASPRPAARGQVRFVRARGGGGVSPGRWICARRGGARPQSDCGGVGHGPDDRGPADHRKRRRHRAAGRPGGRSPCNRGRGVGGAFADRAGGCRRAVRRIHRRAVVRAYPR